MLHDRGYGLWGSKARVLDDHAPSFVTRRQLDETTVERRRLEFLRPVEVGHIERNPRRIKLDRAHIHCPGNDLITLPPVADNLLPPGADYEVVLD
jgi:hypothetical protein